MEASKIPPWLSRDFLRECLESDKENFSNINVTKFVVESAVEAGNNYKSEMLRVKVDYKQISSSSPDRNGSIFVIVKAPSTSGPMDMFKEVAKTLYEREKKYYSEFIEKTYHLSKHNIVPKPYACSVPGCIVMEDLRASGYAMVDRHKLLDFDHCQLYIKASAKLHALSVAINKKNPALIQSLVHESPGMTKGMYILFKTFMSKGLSSMEAYLEDKPQYKDQWEVIKHLGQNDKLLNLFLEMMRTDRPVKAVTQEDPWCANMMFKYSETGKVTGLKIFDFQRLKFTTPVMEFVAFVWGAMKVEVREKKLHHLCYLYCDSLNKNFLELGCPERITFDMLKEEMDSLSPMIMFIVCSMLPIYIADEVADVNDFVAKDAADIPIKESTFYKLYEGTYFKEYYPQVLDQVIKEGVFENLKRKLGLPHHA